MDLHELEREITMDVIYLAEERCIDTSKLKVNIQTVKSSYGALSLNRWTDGDQSYDEIALNPEMFQNPLEVVDTMLHELAHLYCKQNDIKDTTRGGVYHNKKFKDIAERFGLKCIQGKHGWNTTAEGNEEVLKGINSDLPYPVGKTMIRKVDPGKKSQSKHSIKYVCPVCGISCRATKQIRIICAECDEEMQAEQAET